MKATLNILIADYSPLFREGLKNFVSLDGADVTFIEAETTLEILTKGEQVDVLDLLILDKAFMRVNMSYQLRCFVADTNTPVVLLCDTLTSKELVKIHQLGIPGVVLKSEPISKLNHVVNKILAGKKSYPEVTPEVDFKKSSLSSCRGVVEYIHDLTHTEKRVVCYLNHGMMNKEISYQMGIEENTVKRHVSNILQKFRVKSRTQLIVGLQSHIPTVKHRYEQRKETQCLY